eukprot:CAMPEP_0202869086 /NCGR_PEP_ID=MMETSP1391-20130828/11811_1 /ASSEMBLY_ACC=CAM_ASM_000867 /TAXON_ID=1034604 /ORGANISM="Chlamydomonas leiostraca, Strain SAG 11-49" /LENGTH=238 /DNA_ID=CAMNT_0049549343 /DNA_START=180 /DNA_END=896 /DNA_ORIENTATION=-
MAAEVQQPYQASQDRETCLETTGSDDFEEPYSIEEPQAGSLQPLPSCSYFTPGLVFKGFQRFSVPPGRTPGGASDWQVSLRVQQCDMSKGYACGVMEALDVPCTRNPIVTFWEAEIIDNIHHNFFTHKWGATRETDMQHWVKFPGWDARIRASVMRWGGRYASLSSHTHVFMRLKEQFYVNAGADCGLTIAGFYYCCVDRRTGVLTGLYYDPCSTPFQYLELKPQAPAGIAFGSYALA